MTANVTPTSLSGCGDHVTTQSESHRQTIRVLFAVSTEELKSVGTVVCTGTGIVPVLRQPIQTFKPDCRLDNERARTLLAANHHCTDLSCVVEENGAMAFACCHDEERRTSSKNCQAKEQTRVDHSNPSSLPFFLPFPIWRTLFRSLRSHPHNNTTTTHCLYRFADNWLIFVVLFVPDFLLEGFCVSGAGSRRPPRTLNQSPLPLPL